MGREEVGEGGGGGGGSSENQNYSYNSHLCTHPEHKLFLRFVLINMYIYFTLTKEQYWRKKGGKAILSTYILTYIHTHMYTNEN